MELPEQFRQKVVERHKSGEGYKKISKTLNIPQSTVASIIKKWKVYHTTQTLPRSGRPSKLSSRARRKLVRYASKRPMATMKQLKELLAETGENVHESTISRSLRKAKLGKMAPRKPMQKGAHLQSRVEFAKKHLTDPVNVWQRVLWSDETKLELSVSGTAHPSGSITASEPEGGSIVLWGCFSWAGIGRLVKIEGKMDGAKYTQILQENLLQSAKRLKLGRKFIFQHDNDSKHKAKATLEWLNKSRVTVLDWPKKSPDLNLIKSLWKDLKIAVQQRSPSNLRELEWFCQEEWAKILPSQCAKLVDTYPERLAAIITAKGAATKY